MIIITKEVNVLYQTVLTFVIIGKISCSSTIFNIYTFVMNGRTDRINKICPPPPNKFYEALTKRVHIDTVAISKDYSSSTVLANI